uniref:Uncharacterized protein n=1 Tax=Rhizophora mucronata TaxID=61149 RepID=A0A2P2MBR6_RHIMU
MLCMLVKSPTCYKCLNCKTFARNLRDAQFIFIHLMN